jgi:hypothetical protein
MLLKEKILVVSLVPSRCITKILLGFCVGEGFFPRDFFSLLRAKALPSYEVLHLKMNVGKEGFFSSDLQLLLSFTFKVSKQNVKICSL